MHNDFGHYQTPTDNESREQREARYRRQAIRDAVLNWLRDQDGVGPFPVGEIAKQIEVPGLTTKKLADRITNVCKAHPNTFVVESLTIDRRDQSTVMLHPTMRENTFEDWQRVRQNKRRAQQLVRMMLSGS